MSNKPLTGGYGCVDIPGFVGWSIKKMTRSEYDHCFIVLDAKKGTILESQPNRMNGRSGAHINNLSEYAGLPMVFSNDYISATQSVMMDEALDAFVGIRYGFPDIALLGIKLATHWQPKFLTDYILDEHRMICSQLVAQFGANFGKDWRCGQENPQLVTPGMLAARIK